LRIEGESIDNSKDDGDANKGPAQASVRLVALSRVFVLGRGFAFRCRGPDEVFDGAGNKIEVKKSVADLQSP